MKHFTRITVSVVLATFALVVIVVSVWAGDILVWQATGVPISTVTYGQINPRAVSDGNGGAIVTWEDARALGNRDIYAQRVTGAGQVLWTVDGVPVSAAVNDQRSPEIASDDQGGAIIVWYDKRNGADYDIFAQRVLSNGAPLWNTNGITICAVSGTQGELQIASDGQGGAIIVWDDNRSSSSYDVYAQRVSSNGTVLWAPNGISLNDPLPFPQFPPQYPTLIGDGENGAYIAWEHSENSGIYIRAQRVLSDGNSLWAQGGITISLQQGISPMLASDGDGGVIAAWGVGSLYAQRILPSGTPAWGTHGITLNVGYGNNVFLIEDGLHGAFVAWQRSDSGYTSSQIRAQHVLSDSTMSWATTGVTTTSMSGRQQVPRLINDGHNGIIVVWQTASDSSGSNYSIWTQRLNPHGLPQWGGDGVQIISQTAYHMHATVVSDLSHGAIVAWEDQRSGATDIFAQHISDFTPTAWIYLPLVRK